jgi:transcription elongation GreA/GreB family factor
LKLTELKFKLISKCKQYVESRMATAKESMDNAQQAANEENKSSVGDKYETGRAMMQIEREKAAQQWGEALKLKHALDQLPPSTGSDEITLGSMVITDSKKIFISIGIGKLTMDGEEFLVVAPTSPLGKALLGLKKNDKLTFNKERITILEIG